VKYWISSGQEYPKIKGIYVVREGKNPLPCIFSKIELSAILEALRLDGWIGYREAVRVLDIVEDKKVSIEHLAARFGEPFETLISYFYGKAVKLDKIPNNEILDFWIVPEFPLTSFIAVLLKRGENTVVLGDVDLLNDEQLRFLLRFLKCDDWLCSREIDFRLLNYADFVVLDSSVNLELFLRYHAELRRTLETSKLEYLPIRIKRGEYISDKEYKVDTLNFDSGPMPRKPILDRFKIVFGKLDDMVYSVLDEMLETMPMPWANFWKLVVDIFKNNVEAAVSEMLRVGLIEIQAGSVIITSKGLKWIAERRLLERNRRGES